MNQDTSTQQNTLAPLPNLIHELRAQRRKISALSQESGTLLDRGRTLLTESKSLVARIEESCTNLAGAYLRTRSTVAELRLRCPSSQGGTPVPKPSTNEPNLVLADSPDLVEALQKAIEILKMGFSDTDGSGRDTLVRCEKVLQRSRSTYTIELPLY